MFCHRCGREADESAAFCSNCGASLVREVDVDREVAPSGPPDIDERADVDESASAIGQPVVSDKGSPDPRKRAALVVGGAVVVVLVVAAAGGWRLLKPEDPGLTTKMQAASGAQEEEAPSYASVPDLVALVGESTFTAEDAINQMDQSPVHYGAGDLAEAYREAGEAAGFTVELVSWDKYEEELGGGRAGWPQGQDPAPGKEAPLGSIIRLIMVDDPEIPSVELKAAAGAAVYTPEKGSAERTALMDACRVYLEYDGLFVVDTLEVKGACAYAVVTPESGGETVACYLSSEDGPWRVRYAVYSNGEVYNGTGGYLGLYGEGNMPDAAYQEMGAWLGTSTAGSAGSLSGSDSPTLIRSASIAQIVPGAEFILENARMDAVSSWDKASGQLMTRAYVLGPCMFDLPDGTSVYISARDQEVRGDVPSVVALRIRIISVDQSDYQTSVRVEIIEAM